MCEESRHHTKIPLGMTTKPFVLSNPSAALRINSVRDLSQNDPLPATFIGCQSAAAVQLLAVADSENGIPDGYDGDQPKFVQSVGSYRHRRQIPCRSDRGLTVSLFQKPAAMERRVPTPGLERYISPLRRRSG